MPEHLKALVVILFLATVIFALARASSTAVAIAPADFRRRRNLWYVITLVAFLSGNFWIYVLLSALILLLSVQAERNKVALFLALLFAVPPAPALIGGLGLVEHLFPINHVRLLSLTVLLPAFLSLVSRPDRLRFGSIWPDRLLLGFMAVNVGVMLYVTTFTNVLRQGLFIAFLDVFLPYYVASRALRDLQAFRDAMMSMVVAALVLSAIGIFEMLRHWILYSSLLGALEVEWGLGKYLGRGNLALRGQASTGHPIVLGFVIATALGCVLYVRTFIPNMLARRLVIALLVGGLGAALSRGPWVGAAATVLVFIATGPGAGRQIAKYAVIALLTLPMLRSLPGGQTLVELLPFVGSIETENIDYRRRLLDVAFEAIWKSPWFGGIDIYASDGGDSLNLGGGFVDVVNTFVGILLGSGFVGLFFFLGFFATICLPLYRTTRRLAEDDDERGILGRSLLATVIGMLVSIVTVSSISIIPTIYWCVAGMAVAYLRVVSLDVRSPVRHGDKVTSKPDREITAALRATVDR
jgi:hypothetical protein